MTYLKWWLRLLLFLEAVFFVFLFGTGIKAGDPILQAYVIAAVGALVAIPYFASGAALVLWFWWMTASREEK